MARTPRRAPMMPRLCVMMGAAGSRRPDGPRPRQTACPGPGPFVTRPGTLTRGTQGIMLSSATYPIDTPDGDAPGERRQHHGQSGYSACPISGRHPGNGLRVDPARLRARYSLHALTVGAAHLFPVRQSRPDLLFLRGKPAPLASAYSDWTP